jgi:hypothetical protein
MFSRYYGLKFAGRTGYVNNFMLIYSRFIVQVIVFVFNNFNIIKGTQNQVVIVPVVQQIPAFMGLAPARAYLPGFLFKFIIKTKPQCNLKIAPVVKLADLYHKNECDIKNYKTKTMALQTLQYA